METLVAKNQLGQVVGRPVRVCVCPRQDPTKGTGSVGIAKDPHMELALCSKSVGRKNFRRLASYSVTAHLYRSASCCTSAASTMRPSCCSGRVHATVLIPVYDTHLPVYLLTHLRLTPDCRETLEGRLQTLSRYHPQVFNARKALSRLLKVSKYYAGSG